MCVCVCVRAHVQKASNLQIRVVVNHARKFIIYVVLIDIMFVAEEEIKFLGLYLYNY
jgi:hypothetical protein